MWSLDALFPKPMAIGTLEPTAWHAPSLTRVGVAFPTSIAALVLLGDADPNKEGTCDQGLATCASRVVNPATGKPLLALTSDEMIVQIDPSLPPKRPPPTS